MWGRKRIRGPKIIIALIDFNQTVFRLGDAETETVIFNDFLEFKSKIVFVLSENFGWDGRTDGRTKVVKSCNKGEEKQSGDCGNFFFPNYSEFSQNLSTGVTLAVLRWMQFQFAALDLNNRSIWKPVRMQP